MARNFNRHDERSGKAGLLPVSSPLGPVRADLLAHGSSREFQSRHHVPFYCSASTLPRYLGQAIKYSR